MKGQVRAVAVSVGHEKNIVCPSANFAFFSVLPFVPRIVASAKIDSSLVPELIAPLVCAPGFNIIERQRINAGLWQPVEFIRLANSVMVLINP